MRLGFEILKKINLLSIDVALGAMINHWVFCKLLGISNVYSGIILGCSTFIIYALDRYLDIIQNPAINTERHIFYAKNNNFISIFMVLLFLGIIAMLSHLSTSLFFLGFCLTFISGLYGLLVYRFPEWHQYHKEFFVSLIYTLGVAGSAMIQQPKSINLPIIIVAINLFVIVGQVLLIFSNFEILEGCTSKNMATWIGRKNSEKVIFGAVLLVFISLFWLNSFAFQMALVQFIMVISFMLIHLFKDIFIVNKLYRPVGEAIFLMPLILLLR